MKLIQVVSISLLAACAAPTAQEADETIVFGEPIESIYWSDGDSGRIDGVEFRLSNIDAPETGGVGAAVGGAKCEGERVLGFNAKEFVVEMTRDAELEVTGRYGQDRYDRYVIDLSANEVDVAQAGLEAGVFGEWTFENGRAKTKRPVWCE